MLEAVARAEVSPITISPFPSQPFELRDVCVANTSDITAEPAVADIEPTATEPLPREPEIVAINAALVAIASIARNKALTTESRDTQLTALRCELFMHGFATTEFRILLSAALHQPAAVGRALREDGAYNRSWHS